MAATLNGSYFYTSSRDMTEENEVIAPWYKQPWLWFILTPLIAVFIYGFSFLYLSIVTMDGVVKDDYYRIARGYEVKSEKNQRALDQNIEAQVKLDTITGDVMVSLSGNLNPAPASLTLDIVHPTHQKYDQAITLKAIGAQNLYTGSLTGKITGKRFLFLFPADESWHLHEEMQPPYDQKTVDMKPEQ